MLSSEINNPFASSDKEELQIILKNASDAVHILDPEGNVVLFSDSFANSLGYTHEEASALHITQWDVHFSAAELKDKIKDLLHGSAIFKTQHRRKDGTIFDVEINAKGVKIRGDLYLYASSRNISERKKHEEKIKLLASIFSATHDGIMICDANEMIVDVNPAFTEIVGYTKEEVLRSTPRILSSGMQSRQFYANMWKSIKQHGFWKGEMWNRNKNGEFYAVQTNISLLRDDNGAITHYIGTFSDITSLKSHEEALDHLAHYDPLTNLPNRALLADRLNMALSHAFRKKSLLAICFIDLDGFKPINDTYGHEAGDSVLIEIARRLKEEVRADDTIARLGGDEFVILLSDIGDIQNLEMALERFLIRIRQPLLISGHRLQVSASIGVSLTASTASDPDILLRQADQAMYIAKQMGRNRFHLVDAHYENAAHLHHSGFLEIK